MQIENISYMVEIKAKLAIIIVISNFKKIMYIIRTPLHPFHHCFH